MARVAAAPVARPNGASVAAFLAAAVGLLAMGLAVLAAELSPPVEEVVSAVGRAWGPAAGGIAAYAGKETVLLAAWLASWAILHIALRRRALDVRRWFGAALAVLAAAVLLVWPPTWRLLGA